MSESVIVLNPIQAEITAATPLDVNVVSPDPLPVTFDSGGSFPISFPSDSSLYSAFGRLRVANPLTLWDTQFQYDKLPDYWEEATSGTSSATHLPNESAISFSVGSGATDYVVRQTHNYIRYRPGKSQLIVATGNLGGQQADQYRRIGYFDDRNGVFLELDGTNVNIVLRSYSSGSLQETRVAKSNWNLNTFSGSDGAPVLDITKVQIFVVDLEWLGVGRVRTGFFYNGTLIYAHEFNHANITTTTYMTTANLPIRYEVRNTASQGGPTTGFKQICSTVISEGGESSITPDQVRAISTGLGATVTIPTSLAPILSIRLKQQFNGIDNRGLLAPLSYDALITGSKNCYWELRLNATLNATSWTSVNSESISEYNTDATTVSGGHVVACGFLAGVNQSKGFSPVELKSKVFLSRNIDCSVSDTATIVMRSLESSSNAGYVSMQFVEYY